MWWLAVPPLLYGAKKVYDYFTEDDYEFNIENNDSNKNYTYDKDVERKKQDIEKYKEQIKEYFRNKYNIDIKINDKYLNYPDRIGNLIIVPENQEDKKIIIILKHNNPFDKEIDKLTNEINDLKELIITLEEEKCKI
jgi:hypothetical protein